jgi:glycerol 3-phosphatase-2
VAALRHATGVEPLVAGKPEPPLMRESVERTGARRPLVVGDRLDTDIEGATRSGIPSLLVLTGVTDWEELLGARDEHRPTFLDDDLRALLRPAPAVAVAVGSDLVEARCGGMRARIPVAPPGDPDGGSGADSRDPAWWVPARLRTTADRRGTWSRSELEAVRAVVAVAWTAADLGLEIQAEAAVDAHS